MNTPDNILKFPLDIEEERRRSVLNAAFWNRIESMPPHQYKDVLGTIWEHISMARERRAQPPPDNVIQIGVKPDRG